MSLPIEDSPPIDDADVGALLAEVTRAAASYLEALDGLPARDRDAERAAARFTGALPEQGLGAVEALKRLLDDGAEAATRSAGPRFLHFVTGGATPAALAADWFTSVLDNNAFHPARSPLGTHLETLTLGWLRELFDLPPGWGGAITSGATMANVTALAAARQWWGERHGVDIAASGLSGLPPLPVLSGGFVHASVGKALATLGVGSASIRVHSRDGTGRVDLAGVERALRELDGAPAVVVATAAEVNTGRFDPIAELARLAHDHGAWLHVDGAFGLFARVSPANRRLTEGIELADSVISDGHKWLNVPYDCGFAFVADPRLLPATFGMGAPYLSPGSGRTEPMVTSPEMSRRARAIAIWATLAAYGRDGYRALVERHVNLARRLADQIAAAADFQLLEPPVLNVVCFRYAPPGVPEHRLDELNRQLGDAVLADGRIYFGTTIYDGKVAFRPTIANWRTAERDVDLVLPVAGELAAGLLGRLGAG